MYLLLIFPDDGVFIVNAAAGLQRVPVSGVVPGSGDLLEYVAVYRDEACCLRRQSVEPYRRECPQHPFDRPAVVESAPADGFYPLVLGVGEIDSHLVPPEVDVRCVLPLSFHSLKIL